MRIAALKTVCKEWREDIHSFMRDTEEGYSDDLTIDRINNNGNYEPGNVRWATKKQQSGNRENVINARVRGLL